MTLNPYQGLKQGYPCRAGTGGNSDVTMTLNPYQGLKLATQTTLVSASTSHNDT